MNRSLSFPSPYRPIWYALCAASYAGPPILAMLVILLLLSLLALTAFRAAVSATGRRISMVPSSRPVTVGDATYAER